MSIFNRKKKDLSFYALLGVQRSATQDEIKKAYLRKAKENHPDANRDKPDAEKLFADINEAYQTLKNPETRKNYDRTGLNKDEQKKSKFDFSSFGFSTDGESTENLIKEQYQKFQEWLKPAAKEASMHVRVSHTLDVQKTIKGCE